MRTNVEIDNDLMEQALKASGEKTKKAAIETALRMMVRIKSQEGIRSLRGKGVWEGDLEESRRGRFADEHSR